MARFDSYRVIVTGAGTGIGYGIVEAFANEGALVTLNDIDAELAAEAAEKINGKIGAERVFPSAGDVADVDYVQRMIDDFTAAHGSLTAFIANAGITNYGTFLDYTPENFDRLMAVNLRGSYFCAQRAARHMIANDVAGRIVLMSSVTGVQAVPNLGAYGITKAGLRHMAKSIALEVGEYGIAVNAIAPGATVTSRTVADDPEYAAHWSTVSALKQVGYPSDIAGAALFLSSPEARHITGQTLIIDGGWTIYSVPPKESPEYEQ